MNYELIKIICKRRGMSQNELVRKAGITSPGFYMGIKKQTFTVVTLEKISEVLKVNPGLFFKEDLSDIDTKEIEVVNYSSTKPINNEASNSVELIELLRFKIDTLQKEVTELKSNTKLK